MSNRQRKTVEADPSNTKDAEEIPIYDPQIFVSQEAYDYFWQHLRKINIIAERGFHDLNVVRYPAITSATEELHWKHFAEHPVEELVAAIVKEFYANAFAEKRSETTAKVRGRTVNYSVECISQVLHLGPLPLVSTYQTLQLPKEDGGTPFETVLAAICDFTFPVQVQRNTNHSICFIKQESLRKELRPWNHFVCSSLLPTEHRSEIYPERAYMLYAIHTLQRVDTAQILYDHLRLCITAKLKSLFFPSLICALCRKSKVAWKDIEVRVKLKTPMTERAVQTIMTAQEKRWRAPVQTSVPDPEPAPAPTPQPAPVFDVAWANSIEQRLDRQQEMLTSQQEMLTT